MPCRDYPAIDYEVLISCDNLEALLISKRECKTARKNIWKNLSLKQIGLPSGSNDEKPDVFYANNDKGKENAILFTLATLIAYYFNNKIITNIMQKLLKTKIYIIHVSFNNNGVYFTTPTEVTYKFHYWGNYKNITNNLPGFKAIYDK